MSKAKFAVALKFVVSGVQFCVVLTGMDQAKAVEQLDRLSSVMIAGGLSLVFVEVVLESLRWPTLSRIVLGIG